MIQMEARGLLISSGTAANTVGQSRWSMRPQFVGTCGGAVCGVRRLVSLAGLGDVLELFGPGARHRSLYFAGLL